MALAKSYGLNLELPTIPEDEEGPGFYEFQVLYTAARKLQDAISETAGDIAFDFSGVADVNPSELYGLNRYGYLVMKAGTAIAVGQPCQIYEAGGEALVRQPGVLEDPIVFGLGSINAACYMPLFAADAGEYVAVVSGGGLAPVPGATLGTRYGMSSALTLSSSTGKVAPYWVEVGFFTLYSYCYLGVCIQPGLVLLHPNLYVEIH